MVVRVGVVGGVGVVVGGSSDFGGTVTMLLMVVLVIVKVVTVVPAVASVLVVVVMMMWWRFCSTLGPVRTMKAFAAIAWSALLFSYPKYPTTVIFPDTAVATGAAAVAGVVVLQY